MFTVSIVSILIAALANVIIAAIWYHPRVFGAAWMRNNSITPQMVETGKKRMPLNSLLAFLSGMLIAWLMNVLGVKLGIFDWIGAVIDLAFWCWAAFVAPIMLSEVLWHHKPVKLFLIDVFYWLVSFIVMALILVFLA